MGDKNVELIEKASSGDLVAFQEIIRSYSSRVHAIAYQMVGNSIDAQDIAQEVFIRLFRSIRTYKPRFTFTTWLYRLTINRSIDHMRKNSRHRGHFFEEKREEIPVMDSASSPQNILERNEWKGAIQNISKGLTENQRKVFVLRDLQGFSTDEVAQILKCRASTVRVHLSKARHRIRETLAINNALEKARPHDQIGE